MSLPGRIVIVGAGQAAAQAAETLRRRGFHGQLCLVGDEPHLPYQRPPLSKRYLAGAIGREGLLLRPFSWYAERDIETHLGRRVEAIDRRAHRVRLDDSRSLAYDALLLATGARPRTLNAPGIEPDNVRYLRTIGDADRFCPEMRMKRRLVIIGGGYIGLEVAATARELGLEVTVLESGNRVMSRVVCEPVSAFYQAEHARRGVRIICGVQVRELAKSRDEDRVRAVVCEDGTQVEADLVLIGVGAVANEQLAAAAGLECNQGIVVDERCRTSDPHIFAAGDCATRVSVRHGCRVRLESVDNAVQQGERAALAMLNEPDAPEKVPWFWSDQYDLKLITVGLCTGADTKVVRGNPEARSFSVCYLRAGELIAMDAINRARDQMAARKLIAARSRPDPQKLADPEVSLAQLG